MLDHILFRAQNESARLSSYTGGGGRLRGSWDANYPCPPPPLGAFGQQLVAKGVALRPPWAPTPNPLSLLLSLHSTLTLTLALALTLS